MTTALVERHPVQIPSLDSAVTETARDLWAQISHIFQDTDSSSVTSTKQHAANRLRAAYLRGIAPNWDGEGARPIAASTCEYALQLISLLPADLSVPDIYPEPDGDLAFEWDFGHRSVLSISVSRDGTLTFAGLFGRSKNHGVEYLGDRIPETIWVCLSKLVNATV